MSGRMESRAVAEIDRRTMELSECQRLWPSGRVCCQGPREAWTSFGFAVRHRGYWITAFFHEGHPLEAPRVFIDPAPSSSSHYYVHAGEDAARLCFVRAHEWSSRHTLLVAIGCAMRFLNEFERGSA